MDSANTYLDAANVQSYTTLICSLFFMFTSFWFQQNNCKKNILVNIWLSISISLGLISFVTSYVLIVGLNSIGATGTTTSIIVVWLISVYSEFFQVTAFLMACVIELYCIYKHSSYTEINSSNLLNDGNERHNVVSFTWKRFLISVAIWLCITVVIGLICVSLFYAIGALN